LPHGLPVLSFLGGSLAIETVVVTKQINPEKVALAYHKIMSEVESEDFNRAEVMAAIAVILGTQWNGAVMSEGETERFIKELAGWLAMYFVRGTEQ